MPPIYVTQVKLRRALYKAELAVFTRNGYSAMLRTLNLHPDRMTVIEYDTLLPYINHRNARTFNAYRYEEMSYAGTERHSPEPV